MKHQDGRQSDEESSESLSSPRKPMEEREETGPHSCANENFARPKAQPQCVFHSQFGRREVARFATSCVFPPWVFTTNVGEMAPLYTFEMFPTEPPRHNARSHPMTTEPSAVTETDSQNNLAPEANACLGRAVWHSVQSIGPRCVCPPYCRWSLGREAEDPQSGLESFVH